MKRIFFEKDGRMRLGWLLALGMVLYALATLGVYALYWTVYRTMMDTWGVTSQNVARAPGAVRFLYSWSNVIVRLLQGGLLVCAAAVLRKAGASDEKPARQVRVAAIGAVCGAVCVAAVWGVLMLTGSVRLGWRLSRPEFSINTLALLLLALADAVGEGGFLYGAMYGGMKRRLPEWAALLIVVSIGMLTALAEGVMNAAVLVNEALLTLLCCLIADRAGIVCALGFRFAWDWTAQAALGLAGASAALYETYPVNMYWLNGGSNGFMGGLLTTAVLLGLCVYLLCGRRKDVQKREA